MTNFIIKQHLITAGDIARFLVVAAIAFIPLTAFALALSAIVSISEGRTDA